jgi:hypothetical protein
MTKIPKGLQWLAGSIAIFAITASTTAAVIGLRPFSGFKNASDRPHNSTGDCKTIVRDPDPPINVRSSPIVAPDNIINTLANGSQIIVVDEKVFTDNEPWLRISAPYPGWVAKKLTVTSCVPVSQTTPTDDGSAEILAQARDQYHAGQLAAAIALAETVPQPSLTYDAAKAAIVRWQTDWKTAEATFNEAQQALNQGQWQDVIVKVQNFPDNRFWRDKLTPLVRKAMDQKHRSSSKKP